MGEAKRKTHTESLKTKVGPEAIGGVSTARTRRVDRAAVGAPPVKAAVDTLARLTEDVRHKGGSMRRRRMLRLEMLVAMPGFEPGTSTL